jgi:hypothetical protein
MGYSIKHQASLIRSLTLGVEYLQQRHHGFHEASQKGTKERTGQQHQAVPACTNHSELTDVMPGLYAQAQGCHQQVSTSTPGNMRKGNWQLC